MKNSWKEDASVPIDVRNDLIEAIQGNTIKQDSISYEDFNFKYEVFSSIDGDKEISKAECYFNIASLYLNGDQNSKFTVDKEKALKWWKLSSDNGFYLAAVYAGDMLKEGDGVSRDYSQAFDFYQKAHELSKNGIVYDRLGDCYYFGYGTQKDKNKAYECYLNSAFDGDSQGLYKLLKMTDEGYGNADILLLSKAASSIDYDGGYFEVAYGDIDGYKMSDDKKSVVKRLAEYWDKETDPAVKEMKASSPSNKWFSADFMNKIKKTVYSYSYYGFVEEDGVRPNLTLEEAKSKIKEADSEEDPCRDISANIKNSVRIFLNNDGTISGNVNGRWELSGENYIRLTVNGVDYSGVVLQQWDAGLKKYVMTFSAISKNGNVSIWGSKL